MNKKKVHLFNSTTSCPCCKKELCAAKKIGRIDEDAPQKGHIAVCFGCGALLEFTENSSLIYATTERLADMKRDSPLMYCKLILMSSDLRDKYEFKKAQQN